MKLTSRKRIFFIVLLAVICSIAYFVGRPVAHVVKTSINDSGVLPEVPHGYADDVSRLNKTKVDSIITISSDKEAAYRQLKILLQYASANKLPVSIAGARHSMGGHTIAPDGIVINMLPFKNMTLDTVTGILTVGAGALWADIIPYLDKHGRAVSVMQSDNAFSIGGSLSVNCHGWQHNKPPIASTVKSFRLINAKGEILNCSREENKELFSLALGGYGLFGIILEADLITVPNEAYTSHRIAMLSEKYLDFYSKYIDANDNVRMVYGRLNVNRKNFLREAMLNFFALDTINATIPSLSESKLNDLKRSIFIGSKDDDYGKELRWKSEKMATKMSVGDRFSRNQIMNDSPYLYMNKAPDKTDILHEYFIPRKKFNDFVKVLQKTVPKYKCDLLNVTIRNVYKDEDVFLRYAHEEVFGFVMFYNQPITDEGEAEMKALTQELIQSAIELGGTYYLPYRLHATPEEFQQAYPMATQFFDKKKQYDPGEIFQNKFYQQYGKEPVL